MSAPTTTTSPFGSLAVIVDATATSRGGTATAEDARRVLEASGLEHAVFLAEEAGGAARLSAEALGDGFRFLAAVGDDRTVQDVVNGMFRDGRPIVDDPVLAVLPTADSDLVRCFGLPMDLDGAAGHLLGEETYGLDVMKVTTTDREGNRVTRYGHNLGEVGFHAAATARSSRGGRTSRVRRFLGFWSAYARSAPRDVRLQVDGREREIRAWSVIVGNGQFADGGMRLSPRSYPGDGVLDTLAFVGPRSDAYRLLPRMFRFGDHVPDPNIREARARLAVTIDADRPMPVVVDGVVFGTTPVSFQVMPQPIRLKL
jgi:diacylglycerol kinase family enzyme